MFAVGPIARYAFEQLPDGVITNEYYFNNEVICIHSEVRTLLVLPELRSVGITSEARSEVAMDVGRTQVAEPRKWDC